MDQQLLQDTCSIYSSIPTALPPIPRHSKLQEQHQLQQQQWPATHTGNLQVGTPAAAAGAAAAAAAAAAVAVAEGRIVSPAYHSSQQSIPELSSLCFFLHGSIPMLQRRLPIIRKRLEQLGITLAPLNALSSSGCGSSSSSKTKRDRSGSSKQSVLKVGSSSSSSSVSSFPVANITHVILHAAVDGSSSGGSSKSSNDDGTAAASSLRQLLSQIKQVQQQQQRGSHVTSRAPHLVSDAWLDAVLAAGQYVPEQQYSLDHLISTSSDQRGAGSDQDTDHQIVKRPRLTADLDPSPDAPMGRFAMWLGHWDVTCNQITTQVELVLQARYNVADAAQRGPNESVRAALKELSSYEEAIGGSKGDPGVSNLNHEALTYAHAAAVVRGCAFPLSPALSPNQLQRLLPFVGNFMAKIIHQLLTSGTCDQLQCFRQDLPVTNSRGDIRHNTAGAATRALFTKLPGVGPVMAEKWFRAGYRSIGTLLKSARNYSSSNSSGAHAAAGSAFTSSGSIKNISREDIFPLSREAVYSLEHSADLLETINPDDITEMQQEVLKTLVAVTPGVTDGWVMQQVGGAVRGGATHDADWLITNNKCDPQLLEGLVMRAYEHMVKSGRLVPQDEGFCRVQVGKLVGYKEKARKDLLEKTDRGNRHQLDHYDHIWGIYITSSGKRRRMDLIFVPPDCNSWVFAYIGWSGSKQYLRFMRTHAGNCGMFLNSHFMMREVMLRSVAAAPEAVHAPGSRLSQQQQQQQTQTQQTIKDSIALDQQLPPTIQPAAISVPAENKGTCNSCIPATPDLKQTLAYVSAAAAAGSFKSVVLSVPDEVPPADRSGKEWWPQGWSPGVSAAAADSARILPAAAAAAAAPDVLRGAHQVSTARAQLSDLVAAGVGSDRPVAREEDLFKLLGIPYRAPYDRCC